jgi:hypothetical protein
MELVDEILTAMGDPQSRHAALVHTPIVLSLLAPVFAGLSSLRRGDNRLLRWLSLVCFGALLITALIAAKSGEGAFAEIGNLPSAVRRRVQTHADMARAVWIFAACGLLLSLGAWLRRRSVRQGSVVLSTLVGAASAVWVGIAAHHGGTLVYSFGVGAPPAIIRADSGGSHTEQPTEATEDPRVVFFAREVRPLLAEKCMGCHGPDGFASSGLSLTSSAGVLTGGSRGPAVVPGRPSDSLLIQALYGDGLPRMPYGREPLTAQQIDILSRWVTEGAVWDR